MSIISFPVIQASKAKSDQIMQDVIIALIPGLIASTYFFGIGVLIQLILGCVTGLFCEWLVGLLRRRKVGVLNIKTTLITVMLLVICLPTTSPWYLIVIATFFAIILGKSLFGDVGMNIFNPAMLGFCVVYLSFAYSMSIWPEGYQTISETIGFIFKNQNIDSISSATELARIKASLQISKINFVNPYILLNIFWLLGGVYLWFKKSADWVLSISFFMIFFMTNLIYSFWISTTISAFDQLFLGAVIITSCFIITDPVTAPSSKKARFIYAALVGFIAATIRQFSHMPDSMAFAILLGNLCVPLIDDLIKPKYGDPTDA